MSRGVVGLQQAVVRMFQGVKDQATRIKTLKDSKQTRKFSSALDNPNALNISKSEKLKQAEESLRTVMYLSCWGP